MSPLDLVKLRSLLERSRGIPEIGIGLIDGPVLVSHPDLSDSHIREVAGTMSGACSRAASAACQHGTFVAGILVARRGTGVAAICPECTLLVRPIFAETRANGSMPSATPEELAAAIIQSCGAGARVLNISATVVQPTARGECALKEALDYSARRGVIVVAAAGNEGTVGSSAITRHSWVIPVAACDLHGRPINMTNLGSSIGRRGLRAPGDGVISLQTNGGTITFGGTSVAAPFVTGAIALLWSEFPAASSTQIKLALARASASGRAQIVPPLLDAWGAYRLLSNA